MLYRSSVPMQYGRYRCLGTTLPWGPNAGGACNGTWDYASGVPKCVPNQSVAVPDAVWAQAADKIEIERLAKMKAQQDAYDLVGKAAEPKNLTFIVAGVVALGAAALVFGRMKRRRGGLAGFGRLDCGQELWPPLKKKKKRSKKRRRRAR